MIKGIMGAVIGDIVGSTREFRNVSSQRFKLFTSDSTVTDDSVLTMAIAEWMLDCDATTPEKALLKWGRLYPNAGYGRGFKAFLRTGRRNPVGSTHNGSAMRVSSVGFLSHSYEEARFLAMESALPSHNTPGAIMGAQALAVAIWMAKNGSSKEEIACRIGVEFGIDLSRSYDQVRDEVQKLLEDRHAEYNHEQLLAAETTVPMALTAFMAANDYEQTIRLAVYMGGDSDTLACMAGAVASAYWGVPSEIVEQALEYLPWQMVQIINKVDGTHLASSRKSPANCRRWSTNHFVVYGCNDDDSDGEQGFFDVRPTKFHHHYNNGYPIRTIGHSLEDVASQVEALSKEIDAHPERTYIVREIGISKAGFTLEQIAPLFEWAKNDRRVLLPESFLEYLTK